jgi:hypothetical protein
MGPAPSWRGDLESWSESRGQRSQDYTSPCITKNKFELYTVMASTASRLLNPLLLPRLARASRGALPTQRRARLRVIVFSNPSHSSDTKARAAMDGERRVADR